MNKNFFDAIYIHPFNYKEKKYSCSRGCNDCIYWNNNKTKIIDYNQYTDFYLDVKDFFIKNNIETGYITWWGQDFFKNTNDNINWFNLFTQTSLITERNSTVFFTKNGYPNNIKKIISFFNKINWKYNWGVWLSLFLNDIDKTFITLKLFIKFLSDINFNKYIWLKISIELHNFSEKELHKDFYKKIYILLNRISTINKIKIRIPWEKGFSNINFNLKYEDFKKYFSINNHQSCPYTWEDKLKISGNSLYLLELDIYRNQLRFHWAFCDKIENLQFGTLDSSILEIKNNLIDITNKISRFKWNNLKEVCNNCIKNFK
jgi:hypothetical protein